MLDTLFSDGSADQAKSSTTKSNTTNRPPSNNGNVNWDGIPYHTASGSSVKTPPAPIRDPGPSTSTRVIRGGTTAARSTPPRSTATRSGVPVPPALKTSAPTPPRETLTVPSRVASTPSPTAASAPAPALSTVESNRRSNRREVDAFTAAQTTPSTTRVVRPSVSNDDVVDLVPRVSRRVIDATPTTVAASKTKEERAVAPEKTVAPEKVTNPQSKPAVVAKTQPKADLQVAAEEKPTEQKVAAEAKPAEQQVAKSTTAGAAVPNATLSPPTAYTKPVDPATTAVPTAPTASFMNQPYAASTPVDDRLPAEPVSHRAGPPATAFTTPTATSIQPTFGSPSANGMATNFGPSAGGPPTSQPAIGSGISPNRSYGGNGMTPSNYPTELVDSPGYHGSNQSASQGFGQGQGAGWGARQGNQTQTMPAYETAQAPTDPYGNRLDRSSSFGQTGESAGSGATAGNNSSFNVGGAFNDRTYDPNAARAQAVQRDTAPAMSAMTNGVMTNGAMTNRPAQQTTGIPMRPIAGYTGEPQPGANATANATANRNDNFAGSQNTATTSGVNNRMRSSVAAPAIGTTRAGMVSSELPGIRVVTHGPENVMIRQTNEYEIRVENRGAIDADGLIVRAMIPDWAEVQGRNATRGDVDTQAGEGTTERLIWKIDHLPAGTSEQLFVRLMAARSGTHNVDVDWTLMPQKSVATVKVHEPQLGLTIEGPEQVVYGQSQTYKVRVLNPGDGVAPNVVFTLSPDSTTPQSQRIGDIPPGKEAQFDVELTAQDLGDLKIHGLAVGDLDLRAEANKTIRVAAAQIEAVLNGPELKYQNTEAMYNLQLQNVGTATSERVVATLRIPAGAKYLGGIEGAELRGNTLRWEIAALEPTASRDYQFRCNMAATGEHLFSFECKGTAAGYADVALATKVESISDLVLTINDPVAPAPIGTEVMYEIVVRNRGSREARDVKTLAQFSHGIEPKRIEGQSGEVVTGQVLFDPIPRIGAGEEVRLRVTAIADRAGHHRFRTEVRSGDTVLVAEEATHYMSPQADRVSRRSTDGKQLR